MHRTLWPQPSRLLPIPLIIFGLLTASPAFTAAGDLDCTFGSAGLVVRELGVLGSTDAALQSDGKIILLFASPGLIRLSRFLPSGELDVSFGLDGISVFPLPGSLALQLVIDGQGRFLVAGDRTDGDVKIFAARFESTGMIDTSFGGGDGWMQFDWSPATATGGVDKAEAIDVDSGDRPVIAGWTDANGLSTRMAVARLTAAGVLDTTFGTGGIAFATSPGGTVDDTLRGVKVDAADRIVAIGSTKFPGSSFFRDTLLARWTMAGDLDRDFADNGTLIVDMAGDGAGEQGRDLTFDSMGRILALSSGSIAFVGRFDESGALDPTFGGDGLAQEAFGPGTNQPLWITVQADDKPLVIGFPRIGLIYQFASMRFTVEGELDPGWGGTGVVTTVFGPTAVTHAALLQPDQRLLIVGRAGSPNLAMARYLNDASLETTTSTTITSDAPDPSVVGFAVPVEVAVTANNGTLAPTGTVEVGDGIDSCTLTLIPGAAATSLGSCALAISTAGDRTLTATYGGEGTFCGSLDSERHLTLASPAPTTTTILSDSPDPSVFGQLVTVSFSVSSPSSGVPTGDVTISDGVDSCTASVAAGSCALVFAGVGTRHLTATYAGDSTFAASVSSAETHEVLRASTTLVITGDAPDPSLVGELVQVDYRVVSSAPGARAPTGTVTVTDGSESCSGTVASGSCQLALSVAGNLSLVATYGGDAHFEPSTSLPEPHTVDLVPSTTTIDADTPDPSVFGESVTVTFTVESMAAEPPIGNVTVSDGVDSCSATVAAGSCTLELTTVGARSLTATYAGDAVHGGSVSAIEMHAVQQAATTTSILEDTPDPSLVGQSVSVHFDVTAAAPGEGTPSGEVTITDGVEMCTGTVATGSCSLTFSSSGDRSLVATYGGDAQFESSVSDSEPHRVLLADTTTTIDADTPDPSRFGQPITVSFSVGSESPGAPTGTVTVSDGAETCIGSAPTGSCTLIPSSVGLRSLTATYAGDGAFAGSASAIEPHEVRRAATSITILDDTPDPSSIGQPVMVHFALAVTSPGAGTPTGTVSVTDGVDSCAAPLSSGSCSLTLSTPGARSLVATYQGDAHFEASTSPAEAHQVTVVTTTTTIEAHDPAPSVFGQSVSVSYSVTATAQGTPTGEVTVTDGVDSCTATVQTGSCSVVLTTVGLRSLTASYGGDAIFDGSSDTVEHLVLRAPTVTLLSAPSPNPVNIGEEVSVTFTVDPAISGTFSPTGTASVDAGNGNGCSAPIAIGGCSFTALESGRFELIGRYPGDGSFAPSEATADEELVVLQVPVVDVPALDRTATRVLTALLITLGLIALRRRPTD